MCEDGPLCISGGPNGVMSASVYNDARDIREREGSGEVEGMKVSIVEDRISSHAYQFK